MIAVNVTPGTRTAHVWRRAGAPTAATDFAPRGAHIMMPGGDCGFPFTIWTWLAESSLKLLPSRQANPRLLPKVTFWSDFGVPKGGETARETARETPPALPTDT